MKKTGKKVGVLYFGGFINPMLTLRDRGRKELENDSHLPDSHGVHLR